MKHLTLLCILLFSLPSNAEELRKKIAVVDLGVNITEDIKPYLCTEGHRDFTNTSLSDSNGHGDVVANLIAQHMNKDKYCLLILKWTVDGETKAQKQNILMSLLYAYLQHAVLVNLSLSGDQYSHLEYSLIKLLINDGTTVVVAAGNDGLDLSKKCNIFPSCYKFTHNWVVVGNYVNGSRVYSSNFNGPVNRKEDGYRRHIAGYVKTGTSMSCAVATGKIAQ